MIKATSFFLFLFGLVMGSFLNVVVYRLNHGKNPLKGRSFCPRCKKKIAWYDNVPLLSFALLKGKCRHCQKPISWQYPLVELATGVFTVIVFRLSGVFEAGNFLSITHYSLLITFFYCLLITYCLIAIFVSDWLYETIPDEVTYPAIVISLLYRVFYPSPMTASILSYFLAAFGAAGAFLFLVLITGGKGMGVGDVKLAGLMGLVLGYPKILAALMLAFLTGAVVGVILILLGRKRFGEHVPFGPFLAGATWLSLFWGEKMVAFYLSFLGL